MSDTTYQVSGMTCGHCATAVTEELLTVAGVTNVAVEVESGFVTITSDAPVSDAAVRAAVEEAGYQVLPA